MIGTLVIEGVNKRWLGLTFLKPRPPIAHSFYEPLITLIKLEEISSVSGPVINRAVSGPVKRPVNGSLAGLLAARAISRVNAFSSRDRSYWSLLAPPSNRIIIIQ